MRFLIHENLPAALVDLMTQRDHDAVHARDAGLGSRPDEDVWSLAARDDRILVTRDLDFPLPNEPKPAGLVLLRLQWRADRNQILAAVARLLDEEDLEKVRGKITVIGTGQPRMREL